MILNHPIFEMVMVALLSSFLIVILSVVYSFFVIFLIILASFHCFFTFFNHSFKIFPYHYFSNISSHLNCEAIIIAVIVHFFISMYHVILTFQLSFFFNYIVVNFQMLYLYVSWYIFSHLFYCDYLPSGDKLIYQINIQVPRRPSVQYNVCIITSYFQLRVQCTGFLQIILPLQLYVFFCY